MSRKAPELQLGTIDLIQAADGKLALEASGRIVSPDGPGELVTIGFGQATAENVPDHLKTRFEELSENLPSGLSLWLRTALDSTAPSWLALMHGDGVQLYGVQDLVQNAIVVPGAEVSNLRLELQMRTRAGRVDSLQAVVIGSVKFGGDHAGITLGGVDLDLRLELDMSDVAGLDAFLSDPAVILEGAWRGQFNVELSNTLPRARRKLKVADILTLQLDHASLSVDVSSPAGSSNVALGDSMFDLLVPEFGLVGATLRDVSVAATYKAKDGALDLKGSAELELPDLFESALDPQVAGTRLNGSLHLIHNPEKTRLEIATNGLLLSPSVNLLEISASEMKLVFEYVDPKWSLSCQGGVRQSWSRIGNRLTSAGIAQLPSLADAPDLKGSLSLTLEENAAAGSVKIDIRLLEPGQGEKPFDGRMDGMPIEVAKPIFRISTSFDASGISAWAVSGEGTLSTRDWLHSIIPIDGASFTAAARGGGDATPTMGFVVEGGLPGLALPPLTTNGNAFELFRIKRLAMQMGTTFSVEGEAELLPDWNLDSLLGDLGLGPEWESFVDNIGEAIKAIAGDVTVRLTAPMDSAGDDAGAQLEVIMEPADADRVTFGLLGTFEDLFPGAIPSADGSPASAEFFSVSPTHIRFLADMGGRDAGLSLEILFTCTLFSEEFSASASFRVQDGQPEFTLMAGSPDPFRLPIPALSIDMADAFIDGIADMYDLDAAGRQSLRDLAAIFSQPGSKDLMVFEISNLGLRVAFDEPPALSGSIRLVKLPDFMQGILNVVDVTLSLGASVNGLFIRVETPMTKPLLSIPAGASDQRVDIYVGTFAFWYMWSGNAFSFRLEAEINTSPPDLAKADNHALTGTGVYMPAAHIDVSAGVTATSPPIPMADWNIDFVRDGSPEEPIGHAGHEMGLQIFIGMGDTRFLTTYFQKTILKPTYYMMMPGMVFGGGVIIGGPNPKDFRHLQDLVDALVERQDRVKDTFYAHVEAEDLSLVLVYPLMAFMTNPSMLIPPFFTPIPPFWISPTTPIIGDVFFKRISASANLPGVGHFGLSVERPLPQMPLTGLFEVAALVMSGFDKPIPADSQLRDVIFVRLKGRLALDLVAGLTGSDVPSASLDFELNAVDFVNTLIELSKDVTDTLEGASNVVDKLLDDPSKVVRMIDFEHRKVELGVSGNYDVFGFSLSGSLYLLTPDEVEEQLVLFHENKKPKRVVLKADDSPQPIPVAPINVPEGLRESIVTRGRGFDRVDNIVQVFGDDDAVFGGFVGRGVKAARREQTRFKNLVRNKQKARRKGFERLAEKIIEEVRGGAALADVLRKYGMARHQAEIAAQVRARLRDPNKIGAITEILDSDAKVDAYGGLADNPQRLAAKIVADIRVQDGGEAAARRDAARGALRFGDQQVRRTVYARHIPQGKLATLDADLERHASQATSDEDLTGRISRAIARKFPPRKIKDIALISDGDFETAMTRNAKRGARRSRLDLGKTTMFDADRSAAFLGGVRLWSERDEPEYVAEKIVGYTIRSMAGASPTGAAGFSVQIASPQTPFEVRMRAGVYELAIFDAAGDVAERHPLPAWLTEGPESVNKVREIREKLQIVPKKERVAGPAPPIEYEVDSTLYQQSIFARPEYQVRDVGGFHGPTYIADLLKKPSDGKYIVPSTPTLLAGFAVDLWGNEVGMAGLVAGDGIFLNGYHDITIAAGGFSLELEGEFTVVGGSMWGDSIGAGFTPNSMTFGGVAKFKEGGTTRFEGAASGTIAGPAAGGSVPSLDLDVSVYIQHDFTVEIPGTEIGLAKIVLETDATIGLKFDESGFDFAGDLDVSVGYWEPGATTEEITPPMTVCAKVFHLKDTYPFHYWTTECVTTPGIYIDVPDPDSWNEKGSLAATLALAISPGGLEMKLEVELEGVPFEFALPSL